MIEINKYARKFPQRRGKYISAKGKLSDERTAVEIIYREIYCYRYAYRRFCVFIRKRADKQRSICYHIYNGNSFLFRYASREEG